ncbi:unnamed protein product [Sympodiomycopsis kandeliae]
MTQGDGVRFLVMLTVIGDENRVLIKRVSRTNGMIYSMTITVECQRPSSGSRHLYDESTDSVASESSP